MLILAGVSISYTIGRFCIKIFPQICLLVIKTLTSIISYLESILIGSTYNLAFASPNGDSSDDDVPDLVSDNSDDDFGDHPRNRYSPGPQPQGNTSTELGQVIDQNPREMSVRELRESLQELRD